MIGKPINFLSLPAHQQIGDYCANLHVGMQEAKEPRPQIKKAKRMYDGLISNSKIIWLQCVVALPVSPAVVVTGEHINFLSLPAHQSR